MSDEVIQDSDAIREVASTIEGDKNDFDRLTEEFYDLIDNGITESDTGDCAWFGPSANAFAQEVHAQKTNFDNASTNMGTLVSDLNTHADTWDNFEKQ